MSTQYISGHETFDDGDTQAMQKANANAARDAEFAREDIPWLFFGQAQANQVFFKRVFTHDVYVTGIGFNAYFGFPTGRELLAKVKVGGSTKSQVYTLPQYAFYAYVETTNETDILVTAGQALELFFSQVGSESPGENVSGFIRIRKVKLYEPQSS